MALHTQTSLVTCQLQHSQAAHGELLSLVQRLPHRQPPLTSRTFWLPVSNTSLPHLTHPCTHGQAPSSSDPCLLCPEHSFPAIFTWQLLSPACAPSPGSLSHPPAQVSPRAWQTITNNAFLSEYSSCSMPPLKAWEFLHFSVFSILPRTCQVLGDKSNVTECTDKVIR